MNIVVIILCVVAGLILLPIVPCVFMYFSMRLISKQFSTESCIERAKLFLGFDIGDSFEVVWNKSSAFPPQMYILLRCSDVEKWNDIVRFCKEQKEYEKREEKTEGYRVYRCYKRPETSVHLTPNGGQVSYTFSFIKSVSGYQKGQAEGDSEIIKICYDERLILYYRV